MTFQIKFHFLQESLQLQNIVLLLAFTENGPTFFMWEMMSAQLMTQGRASNTGYSENSRRGVGMRMGFKFSCNSEIHTHILTNMHNDC